MRIKVFFPNFYTEAHREVSEGEALVKELSDFDVLCQNTLTNDCDFIFCGGFLDYQDAYKQYKGSNIPIIHYSWDIYPFNVNGDPKDRYTRLWKEYLEALKTCFEIWVPSECTVDRTREFTGRDSVVIKTSVRPFPTKVVNPGNCVIDPMRRYPDQCAGWVQKACAALGIPCVETKSLSNSQYREAVGGCRLLVTSTYEASTGSLCLLEGYYHGKPILVTNSPRNGAVDYFGSRATYFDCNDFHSLVYNLEKLWNNPPSINVEEAQSWVNENYGEKAFAFRIANRLRELKCLIQKN